ncbi:MAG TPA: hypothetical protein V6C97_00330 [Oculatellaceae cyanobacterium]
MKSETVSETIEFPKSLLVLGNLALLVWLALGITAFSAISAAAGFVFLLFDIFGIYGALRIVGSLTPSYHCKKCTLGLRRISALYFANANSKITKCLMG